MISGGYRHRLVIMVKAPLAGRVKTRLAGEIGAIRAASAYRIMLAATLRRLARDRRWETWLAVSPDRATGARYWPDHVNRVSQGGGNLGQRMQRLFDQMPPGPVIIIGSDIPDITSGDIAGAFRRLGAADAVLGPAADGGYWLIGAGRHRRVIRPFSNVRWSGPHAMADTLADLSARRVVTLRQREDVDDAQTYRRWRAQTLNW